MKFLHLSDLHLGRRLYEMDLTQDQEHILARCVQMAVEHQVDGVLVAGDVYDRSVPSVQAVNLLDSFFTRLSQKGIPVYLISGNHDSADRLGFGAALLQDKGVHLASNFGGCLEHYLLEDEHGPLHLWAMPFLRPSMVRSAWPEESVEDYTQAVALVLKHCGVDMGQRNVIMAHQFVVAAGQTTETCESETLSLGTLDHVDASVFDGFDYVALGHIHSPQKVGSDRVRYCGSPLAYSVSEWRHQKGAVLVELKAKGEVEWQVLPFSPLRALRRIEGTLEQLLEHAIPSEDYFYAVLTDAIAPMYAAQRLRSVYPNLVKLEFKPEGRQETMESQLSWNGGRSMPSAMELFAEFYESVHHRPLSQQEQTLMQTLFETLEGGQAD